MIRLFLDDERPVPEGWVGARTIEEAKILASHNTISSMSLDHDLGACDACMKIAGVENADQWLEYSKGASKPHCPHVGTGLDFVKWLVEVKVCWPLFKPNVHSANPAGARAMNDLIDKEWGKQE